MALLSERSWEEWIAQYEQSHQHPVNRRCHTIGIPLIVSSGLAVLPALFLPELWWVVGALFTGGWLLQFVGHAFEGKPPEFFKDGRFLLVGVRWWLWKAQHGAESSR